MDIPTIDYDIPVGDYNDAINHIEALAIIFSFLKPVSKETKRRMRVMGPKSEGLIDKIYTAITVHHMALPQNFDILKFKRDRELLKQLESLHAFSQSKFMEALPDTILLLRHQIMKMGDGGWAGLKVGEKLGGEPMRDSVAEIKEIRKRKKAPPQNTTHIIGKGESQIVDRVADRTLFKNIGNTLLEISKGDKELTDPNAPPKKVIPDTHFNLPKGWTRIFVKNVSRDMDGKFTVKMRLE